MECEPLVSVIVPVYNASAYLERCINSILQQTYQNIELILVNDGSTDDSLQICRRYARQDSRVSVIDQCNRGVSESRNAGMARAKGIYLQFADSDDWLVPTATERMVEKAEQEQCQLVIAPFYRVVGRMLIVNGHIRTEEKISLQDFALQMLMKAPANFYYGVMWNKLYRRDLIDLYKLRCEPDITWCEDFIFNLHYLQHVQQIYVLQQPVYYYVKRKGSLVSTELHSSNVYEMKRSVFEHYRAFYDALGLYDDYRGAINGFMVSITTDSLFRLPSGVIDKEGDEIFFEDYSKRIARAGEQQLPWRRNKGWGAMISQLGSRDADEKKTRKLERKKGGAKETVPRK